MARTAWSAILLLSATAAADPIKVQPVAVDVSGVYGNNVGTNVTDGNPATIWNSGGYPTQSIRLDLGRTYALGKVRLLVAQSPSGSTNHTIYAGQDVNNLTQVAQIVRPTSDGDWLEVDLTNTKLPGGARYVKVTTTQSPSWVAWKEIEVYQNVEYFGYFRDVPYPGPDYSADTYANGANIFWANKNPGDVTALLSQGAQRGERVVLDIGCAFFNCDTGVPWDGWETAWTQYVAAIQAGPPNTVAAFYLLDEPYYHAQNLALTRDALAMVTARMRQDFPTIPIAVILSVGEVNMQLDPSYLQMFNWIGFDDYEPWGASCGGTMATLISTLRAQLSPTQRMIAVPWGKRETWQNPDLAHQASENIGANINCWHSEVLSDGKYAAVVPYIWVGTPNSNEVGTRDLPWVKERLYQLAHSLFPAGDSRVFPASESASSTWTDTTPAWAAFDRDTSGDMWNSGSWPAQSVVASFGGSTRVGRVTLTVNQDHAGNTTHYIEGLTTANTWYTIAVLSGYTWDGLTLFWNGPPKDVTAIRVRTTQSPTWVAWYDIQFAVN